MRNTYRGFFRPSDDELRELWQTGVLAFDANTLLNLYRYSTKTAGEFLGVLESHQEQIWLPYWAGAEFHRNRLKVLKERDGVHQKVSDAFVQARRTLDTSLSSLRKHEVIDVAGLLRSFDEFAGSMTTSLQDMNPMSQSDAVDPLDDELFHKITNIFEGRVGARLAKDIVGAWCAEGKTRYEAKVPPGYKDEEKGEPDRYGDLFVWKELIGYSKQVKKPVIFVTDDAKEDWWWIESGKTLGPRHELVEEFWNETGQTVYFYSTERFLQFASSVNPSAVSEDAVGEARELAERRPMSPRVEEQLRSRLDELMSKRDSALRAVRRAERPIFDWEPLEGLEAQHDHLSHQLVEVLSELDWVSGQQLGSVDDGQFSLRKVDLRKQADSLMRRQQELERKIREVRNPEITRIRVEKAIDYMMHIESQIRETEELLRELDGSS